MGRPGRKHVDRRRRHRGERTPTVGRLEGHFARRAGAGAVALRYTNDAVGHGDGEPGSQRQTHAEETDSTCLRWRAALVWLRQARTCLKTMLRILEHCSCEESRRTKSAIQDLCMAAAASSLSTEERLPNTSLP